MKPTKEQIEAYKEMAKTSPDSMKAMIEANLKATCDKFAGHEDRLDDCIDYLTECAREILDHKNGEVDNETCYRICRDYFNDEIWKEEDEEKAEREKKQAEKAAKYDSKKKKAAEAKKAEIARKRAETARKKAEAKAKKVTQDFEKEQADKERKRLEKLKEKHGLKAAEPPKKEPEAKKFPTCRVCGREVINVYKEGMCLDCYYKRPMQAEKTPAHTAQIQPEPGQLDFFEAMGV